LEANKVGDLFSFIKRKNRGSTRGEGREEGARLEKTGGIGEAKDGDKEWNRRGW
jgi:hypothetical protein